MYLISQCGENDCAFTCLEILLANLHHDKKYLFLKHDDHQYSFKDLIKIAANYNTELLGVKVDSGEELIKCKDFPFITVMKGNKNERHSVLVLKANKKVVTVFDPNLGKCKIPYGEFVLKWTSYVLIVKNFKETKLDVEIPKLVEPKERMISSAYQFLSGISVLLGTFFIDKSSYFYLPIIFYALFVIFEVLFRDRLLRAMKQIDENIFSYPLIKPSGGYRTLFLIIQEYRYSALTLLPNIIFGLLIVIFLSIILILNSIINVIYIGLALMFAIIEFFIIRPIEANEEHNIEKIERQIYDSENDREFKFYSNKASALAYASGFKRTVFKYIEITILLSVSIGIMFCFESVNVSYVVFYLSINLFLISNLNKIFAYSFQKDKFDSLHAKVINYLQDDNATINNL